jgi:hypothetical protein
MLESEERLRTWALTRLPGEWQIESGGNQAGSCCVVAEQLADHRLAYLDYVGAVRGGRGHVTRVDAGSYQSEVQSTDLWQVVLVGERIRGRVTLSRCEANSNHWKLKIGA